MTADIPSTGLVGPAQSDQLVHFTGRPRGSATSPYVPDDIQQMQPWERLDSILTTQVLKGFPPYGASRPCVCFSESPPDHLAHLIRLRGFQPWGIVLSREQVLNAGGGSISYVSNRVRDEFEKAGLAHWAVRTAEDSTWMHEREWRLPLLPSHLLLLTAISAVLIGDPAWRPSPVATGNWTNGSGERCPGPEDPLSREEEDLPALWRESEIWVWNAASQCIVTHKPGELSW